MSWDYSMNEAGGIPEGLEAYLRQILWKTRHWSVPPMLLVKDTHMAAGRREVLGHYLDYLPDPARPTHGSCSGAILGHARVLSAVGFS